MQPREVTLALRMPMSSIIEKTEQQPYIACGYASITDNLFTAETQRKLFQPICWTPLTFYWTPPALQNLPTR